MFCFTTRSYEILFESRNDNGIENSSAFVEQRLNLMNIKDANVTNTRKSNCRGQKIQKLKILENPNTGVNRYKR